MNLNYLLLGSSMLAIWCVLNFIFMKAEPWVTLKIHFLESCISLKSHRHLYAKAEKGTANGV